MSVYLLETEVNLAGSTAVANADSAVVVAHSVEDARAVAKAQNTGVSGSAWDAAKVTEIEAPRSAEGFRLDIAVSLDKETVAQVSCVGEEGESLDDLASKAAKCLNDTDDINGAAYSRDERVLTVASLLGGDNLGDATLFAAVYPPNATSGQAPGVPGCITAVVHKHEPSDSLQVILAGEGYSLPCKIAVFGSVS